MKKTVLKKKIIQEYNKESSIYDFLRFKSPGGALIDKLEKNIVKKFVVPIKGKKVLDVGTGTGRFAIELAKLGSKVIACDLSEKMLEIGRKKAKKDKVNVKFEKGDVENLPYKNNMFDVVVGIRIVMHLVDYKKGLKEMKRVVKRGGYVIFNIPNKLSVWAKLNKLFRIKKKVIKKIHPEYSPRSFSYIEIEYLLNKIGLRIVEKRGLFFLPETIFHICPKTFLPIVEKIEEILSKVLPHEFAGNIFIKSKRISG